MLKSHTLTVSHFEQEVIISDAANEGQDANTVKVSVDVKSMAIKEANLKLNTRANDLRLKKKA